MLEMKNNLRKSIVIAHYTFLDIVRSKILLNIAFLGIGLVVLTYVAFQFTYGVPTKIALDFGLGTLGLSSVGIALFFGSNLLSKEIEQRTIHMIISRPVSRLSFLVGKLGGLGVILLLNILILSFQTLSVYFLAGGSLTEVLVWAMVFIFIEALIVMLLVVFLALITSQTLSVLLTLALYFVGHALDNVKQLTFVVTHEFLGYIIDIYKFILPAFYLFNLKNYVIYQQHIELEILLKSLCYGATYILGLTLLCVFILNKKNLD